MRGQGKSSESPRWFLWSSFKFADTEAFLACENILCIVPFQTPVGVGSTSFMSGKMVNRREHMRLITKGPRQNILLGIFISWFLSCFWSGL